MVKTEKSRRQTHSKLRMKEALAGYMFALPSLAGFAVFMAVPFLISLYYCFTEGVGAVRFVGFTNFNDLLHSKSFLLASKNTLIFNSVSVPLIMLISLLFAMLLNGSFKGQSSFRTFFIIPMVIPIASVILVWQILFNGHGVLNHLLSGIGAAPVDWLRSRWSVGVLIMTYIWKNCGYNVILFMAGLNSIPSEYYEAAYMDGAGSFACFRKITLPFLVPTGFFVFIISIINSFKVFREAYLLAGSYPDLHIYMLQHFMNNNFYNLSYQRLSTAAFLMAILIFALVFIMFRAEAKFGRNL